ncbi:MAG: hypothetical protein K8R49_08775 [Candidatus Cloacimonetes bacterium]|nr:hypothetical protein [Candidatus Cloacimonadota bacterium]
MIGNNCIKSHRRNSVAVYLVPTLSRGNSFWNKINFLCGISTQNTVEKLSQSDYFGIFIACLLGFNNGDPESVMNKI